MFLEHENLYLRTDSVKNLCFIKTVCSKCRKRKYSFYAYLNLENILVTFHWTSNSTHLTNVCSRDFYTAFYPIFPRCVWFAENLRSFVFDLILCNLDCVAQTAAFSCVSSDFVWVLTERTFWSASEDYRSFRHLQ